MNSLSYNPKLLILEDDPDQLELLSHIAVDEINFLIRDKATSDEVKKRLRSIKVMRVANIAALEKALEQYRDIFLAVLDCNLPDTKGGVPHDQLIKTQRVITGQHKPVDIVLRYLPDTPITMISSLNRFQTIVNKYYESEHGLSINFISKNERSKIKRNIAYYLRKNFF